MTNHFSRTWIYHELKPYLHWAAYVYFSLLVVMSFRALTLVNLPFCPRLQWWTTYFPNRTISWLRIMNQSNRFLSIRSLDMFSSYWLIWFEPHSHLCRCYLCSCHASILILSLCSFSSIQKELDLPSQQILALFNRSIRKFNTYIRSLEEKAVKQTVMPTAATQVRSFHVALQACVGHSTLNYCFRTTN